MKKIASCILIVVLMVIAVMCWWWKSLPVSFLSFIDRDKAYYSELAAACDLFLVQNKNSVGLRLPGNDPKLPKIIRELHAYSVEVRYFREKKDTNAEYLFIESENGGRSSFGIHWAAEEAGISNVVWKLSATGEDRTFELYTITKNPVIKDVVH